MKHFGNFGRHFPRATSAKNPRSMHALVPQGMAQFGLKIELLSHIMGTTPILEMARAYGLRPGLWLLSRPNIVQVDLSIEFSQLVRFLKEQVRI